MSQEQEGQSPGPRQQPRHGSPPPGQVWVLAGPRWTDVRAGRPEAAGPAGTPSPPAATRGSPPPGHNYANSRLRPPWASETPSRKRGPPARPPPRSPRSPPPGRPPPLARHGSLKGALGRSGPWPTEPSSRGPGRARPAEEPRGRGGRARTLTGRAHSPPAGQVCCPSAPSPRVTQRLAQRRSRRSQAGGPTCARSGGGACGGHTPAAGKWLQSQNAGRLRKSKVLETE